MLIAAVSPDILTPDHVYIGEFLNLWCWYLVGAQSPNSVQTWMLIFIIAHMTSNCLVWWSLCHCACSLNPHTHHIIHALLECWTHFSSSCFAPSQTKYYNARLKLEGKIAPNLFANSNAVGMLELYSRMILALQNPSAQYRFPTLFATMMRKVTTQACQWVSPCNLLHQLDTK